MKCPCGAPETSVIDSRDTTEGLVRRRRKCGCGLRFTTYEVSAKDLAELEKQVKDLDKLKQIFADMTSVRRIIQPK